MEKAYKVYNPYLSTKFYQELCVIFNAKYKNGKKQNNLIARKTSHWMTSDVRQAQAK